MTSKKDEGSETTGSKAAYDHFLAKAGAIAAKDVLRPNVAMVLAKDNVLFGVKNVLVHEAEIPKALPLLDLAEIKKLPDLALGAIYADNQVDHHSNGTVAELEKKGYPLRAFMLKAADTLASSLPTALLPAHDVAEIHKGRGKIDAAEDLVALADLFHDNADKIAGKTSVTEKHVEEARKTGDELLAILKHKAAAKRPSPELAKAVDLRNRFFTLLVLHYGEARKAGAYFYGVDSLDEHVPSIGSHEGHKKDKKGGTGDATDGKTA